MPLHFSVKLFLLLLLVKCSGVAAQTVISDQRINYTGKDFWMGLFKPRASNKNEMIITGKNSATVSFFYTADPSLDQSYYFQGGTVLKIKISDDQLGAIAGSQIETVQTASVHIVADTNICIQFVSWGSKSDDGMLLFPSDNQYYGNDYMLNSFRHLTSSVFNEYGSFTIVATCDNVLLEITPTQNTGSHVAGVPFTLALNEGETFSTAYNSANQVCDLSGTRVKILQSICCNPINVFFTDQIDYMRWPPTVAFPVMICCGDEMMEQLLPVRTWDTVYPVVPFMNNPYSPVKIVSASNNNTVYFDGAPVVTLNDGAGYDTMVDRPVVVSSSYPVSITQFMVSQSEASGSPLPPVDSFSDPSALWLMPLRDGVKDCYFTAIGFQIPPTMGIGLPSSYYEMQAVTLISKTSNVPSVVLNNVNIGAQFIPFPNAPDYMYTVIRPDTGIEYHLTSDERIAGYFYGAAIQGSSALNLGDVTFSELVAAPVFNIIPDTVDICTNDAALLNGGQADVYKWSTGELTQQITTKTPGFYSVITRSYDTCQGITRLFWVRIDPYDQQSTADTLLKCQHEVLMLQAAAGADGYLWSDGGTALQSAVTAYGAAYHVVETYQQQCLQMDHEFVVLPESTYVHLDIGNDTTICRGDRIVLTGLGPETLWSTGDKGNTLTVSAPGTYWAAVRDTCLDIVFSDTMVLSDSACLDRYCNLEFPSAFSPNGDGRNDVFRPVHYGTFTGYSLSLYNRWGEKVYQSYKKEEGWDGSYKGMPADMGVYHFLAHFSCPLRGEVVIKGDVTVVR